MIHNAKYNKRGKLSDYRIFDDIVSAHDRGFLTFRTEYSRVEGPELKEKKIIAVSIRIYIIAHQRSPHTV